MGRNKRALSPVIATVLLLLLTVSAAIIIAGVVLPFIRGNLDKSTECVDYRSYFTFEEKFEFEDDSFRYNCYQGDNLYGASIRAEGNEELSEDIGGFKLVFIQKLGDSVSVEVKSGELVSDIRMLDAVKTELEVPKSGEVKTYVYDSGGKIYDKIEVYPLLKSGRICQISDEIALIKCLPNVNLG